MKTTNENPGSFPDPLNIETVNGAIVNTPTATNIPGSLSSLIDQFGKVVNESQSALASGDPELALVRARQGLKVLQTLAATAPELAALLSAASQGHTGYIVEEHEQYTREQLSALSLFGIRVGSCKDTKTETKRTARQFRII